jgi:hypothetical protein
MGRLYRASAPQNVDFMYKLPEQMMLQGTQQAAQDIEQNQAAMLSLYDKLQLPALEGEDSRRAKGIIGNYEDKINEIAQVLQENPLDFRRKSGDLIGLSRSIQQEWTKGEAAAIMGNYAKMEEFKKRYDDMIKSGKIEDPHAVGYLMANIKREFERNGGTKYDPSTGTGNALPLEELAPYVDIQKNFDEYVKGMEPFIRSTSSISGDNTESAFIYEHEGQTQTLSKDRLLDVLWGKFMGDSKAHDYLRQRSKIGMLRGYYDEEGNLKRPFETSVVKDKNGNERMNISFTKDNQYLSPLSPMVAGTLAKFERNDVTKDKWSVSTNQYGLEKVKEANDQNSSSSGSKSKVTDLPDQFNTPVKTSIAPPNRQYVDRTMDAAMKELSGVKDLLLNPKAVAHMTTVELGALTTTTDEAVEAASEGDFTKLDALAKQRPSLKPNIEKAKSIAINALQLNTQMRLISDLVRQKHPQNAGEASNDYFDRLSNLVNTEVYQNSKYSEVDKPIHTTNGNYWSPEFQKVASQSIAGVNEVVENMDNWGGTFYYTSIGADGKPTKMQEVSKSKLMSMGVIPTVPKGQSSDPRTINPIGTASLVTDPLTFRYKTIKGAENQATEDWMIKIPIGSGLNSNPTGYVFLKGNSVTSDKLELLKAAIDDQKLYERSLINAQNLTFAATKYATDNGLKIPTGYTFPLADGKSYSF